MNGRWKRSHFFRKFTRHRNSRKLYGQSEINISRLYTVLNANASIQIGMFIQSKYFSNIFILLEAKEENGDYDNKILTSNFFNLSTESSILLQTT